MLKNETITMDKKFDVSLDEMDFSATQLQSPKPNQDGSTFSKKKKRFLMEVNKFLLHLLMLSCYWGKHMD
ncbi:hypothetical protein Gohar_007479, partial [Gossypium harknessii]|nr:hypothetical protein [Gossypium harknessii]